MEVVVEHMCLRLVWFAHTDILWVAFRAVLSLNADMDHHKRWYQVMAYDFLFRTGDFRPLSHSRRRMVHTLHAHTHTHTQIHTYSTSRTPKRTFTVQGSHIDKSLTHKYLNPITFATLSRSYFFFLFFLKLCQFIPMCVCVRCLCLFQRLFVVMVFTFFYCCRYHHWYCHHHFHSLRHPYLILHFWALDLTGWSVRMYAKKSII